MSGCRRAEAGWWYLWLQHCVLQGCVSRVCSRIVCGGSCGLGWVTWGWAVTCGPEARSSDAHSALRSGQTRVLGPKEARASWLERMNWGRQGKDFLLRLLGETGSALSLSSWELGGRSKDPLPRGQFLRIASLCANSQRWESFCLLPAQGRHWGAGAQADAAFPGCREMLESLGKSVPAPRSAGSSQRQSPHIPLPSLSPVPLPPRAERALDEKVGVGSSTGRVTVSG